MKSKDFIYDHMIAHLKQLCKSELGIKEFPEIELLNQDTVESGNSFGEFADNKITVVFKNRHPIDVMRTLTHELVHWKQHINGEQLDGSDGSSTENEANAVAGIIMRKFGQMYPRYFIDIMQG